MAFLRIKESGGRRYFYIVESRRRGAIIRQKILEYLGRDPSKKDQAEALKYWKGRRKRKQNPGARG